MHTQRWHSRPALRVAAAVTVASLAAGGFGFATATADAAPTTAAQCSDPTRLTFLNFNDFHGRIAAAFPDTVQFAGTLEELRAEAGEDSTIVASAGDNIGGSLFASAVAQDTPTIDLLNALEIDASAVGNHEFDKGFDDLSGRVTEAADFPYLGANVYDEDGEPVLPEYAIVEKQGLRIAIIGAVTQDTPNIVVPDGVEGLTFGDPVAAVNRVAEELKDGDESNGEADVIVAEYHEGGPSSGATLAENMAARPAFANIVDNTSPLVQVVFNAHTHATYAYDMPRADGTTRPLMQSGSYANLIGKVELDVDPATGETCTYTMENLEMSETPVDELVADFPRAAAAKEIVDAALAEAQVIGQEVIGSATAPLARPGAYDAEQERYIDDRTGESTITNQVANMFSDTLSDRTGETVIGVQNPGGTRADLCLRSGVPTNPCADDEFDITYADAASILPFANTLQTTTLTGAEFKLMLEQQWSTDADTGEPTGTFLRLGLSDGVAYSYDESRDLGDRITSVTIDGAPIDAAGEYVVGSGNFLLAGGDNFHVFGPKEPIDSGLVDLETWVDWIGTNSPLSPSFVKRGIEITPTLTELTAGETTSVTVDNLDFSGGYPTLNETLIASVGDVEIGTAQVVDGSASLTLAPGAEVPAGAQLLTFTSAATGTVAYLSVEVTNDQVEPTPTVTPDPTPTETPTETPDPTPTETPDPTPSGTPSTTPSATGTPAPTSTSPAPGHSDRPPLAETGAAVGLIGIIAATLAVLTGGFLLLRRRQG